ncbi:hypothetical protein [Hugenholtzia roseola]|nr:hypothetical protein [Hugenholtzia roseola]
MNHTTQTSNKIWNKSLLAFVGFEEKAIVFLKWFFIKASKSST